MPTRNRIDPNGKCSINHRRWNIYCDIRNGKISEGIILQQYAVCHEEISATTVASESDCQFTGLCVERILNWEFILSTIVFYYIVSIKSQRVLLPGAASQCIHHLKINNLYALRTLFMILLDAAVSFFFPSILQEHKSLHVARHMRKSKQEETGILQIF